MPVDGGEAGLAGLGVGVLLFGFWSWGIVLGIVQSCAEFFGVWNGSILESGVLNSEFGISMSM